MFEGNQKKVTQLTTKDLETIKARLHALVEIASINGYAISIKEILLMLPKGQDCQGIKKIIKDNNDLFHSLIINNGFLAKKGFEKFFDKRTISEKISLEYLIKAKNFSKIVMQYCPYVKLIGVSGSVSYHSATRSDDIDLFLITNKRRLWISMLKILLLARVFKLKAVLNGLRLDFCLSYAKDVKVFGNDLLSNKTPLFAREFLSVHILKGLIYYKKMLKQWKWIQKIFPEFYNYKLEKLAQNKDESPSITKEKKNVNNVLDLLAYTILKVYLSFKSFQLNLRYRKNGRIKDLFKANISYNSLIYNSEKYRKIEKMYEPFTS